MSEYVVLIVGDGDRWWTTATDEEKQLASDAHEKFAAQLLERGHRIIGGSELHRASEARSIAPHGTTVTDGPWSEITEQVGGYYVVASDDLDDLMDCCLVLAGTGDAVEVRRCVQDEAGPS